MGGVVILLLYLSMKAFLIFIFSLYHFYGFSQQSTDIQVEYQVFCDTNIPLTYSAFLSINENVSVYEERFSTTQFWEGHPSEAPDLKIEKFRGAESHYLKIDKNKKELLFFEDIGNSVFLVKDIYRDLAWSVTKDTKTIAGFNCFKATVNYRGRNWIAWFTPDLALSFGPWKLHGLPGLILEVYDETNRYIMRAVKIDYLKNNVSKSDFNTLMATKNVKPMLYEQFLSDKDESINNIVKATASNNNVTLSEVKVPRNGMELKYEWEEQ